MAISLLLPDIAFISPNLSSRHCFAVSGKRCCVSRAYVRSIRDKVRTRAVRDEDLLSGSVNGYGLNGPNNGAATTSRISNGSVGNGGGNGYYLEEAVVLEEREWGNGSLVRYVNGNGVAAADRASMAAGVVEGMTEMEVLEEKEEGRKRRIEEIGKEEAWFKLSGRDQLEVK